MSNKYTIKPFAHPRYDGNSGSSTPCVICGKHVKVTAKTQKACVIDGGSNWGDETSDQDHPGYMGYFPVGPECHKKYLIKE